MKGPLFGVSAGNLIYKHPLVAWMALSIIEFDVIHKDVPSRDSSGRQANNLMTTQPEQRRDLIA
jgi:hypothetical protein